MKIKPLEKDANSRYDLEEVPEKINEIISLLNNSFITLDPDTSIVDGSISSISCDRLTPLANETTADCIVGHIDNMINGGGIYSDIKCPKCGASYFEVGPSVSTCVYYPPIIKDGVNINPDRNKLTTSYTCCECGHRWKE